MPERGQDLVSGSQVLVDGFGLGGRLDNHDVHENPRVFSWLGPDRGGAGAALEPGTWVTDPFLSIEQGGCWRGGALPCQKVPNKNAALSVAFATLTVWQP